MGSQSVPAGGTWHYQGPVWHLAGEGQGAADTLRCTRQTHTSNTPAPGAHGGKALARGFDLEPGL